MGAGASAGIEAAASAASVEDLRQMIAGLPADQRARLSAALGNVASKNILMILTSCDKLGDSGKQTGWYLPECAHPYAAFKAAGFNMTFASPKGGLAPVDEGSVDASKEDKGCMDFHTGEETKKLIANTLALKDVKSDGFDAVFLVGGFGTMWDFPDDADVQRLCAEIYDKGGIVSAVCHGPVGLINVKLKDGSLLIKDKDVTAFTNAEEDAVSCREIVPYTCEDKMKALGANFSDGGVFQANVKVAGRLITGQNPPSADPCAKAVVKALTGKKEILMVLTSHDKLGDSGKQTGWYLPECAHPYAVFKAAGFNMTFASTKGGLSPVDEGSVDASKEDKGCMDFNTGEETKKLIANTVAVKDVKSDGFDAIFLVGGFGTMWDFPDNVDVQRLCAEIYDKGGIVSAVCHGPVGLLNVKLADGSLLVKGKEVTAFTNAEEDAVSCREIVPYTCEDKFKEIGATFSDGGVFQANVKVADRLITGQNPPSAQPTAEAVVKALS